MVKGKKIHCRSLHMREGGKNTEGTINARYNRKKKRNEAGKPKKKNDEKGYSNTLTGGWAKGDILERYL